MDLLPPEDSECDPTCPETSSPGLFLFSPLTISGCSDTERAGMTLGNFSIVHLSQAPNWPGNSHLIVDVGHTSKDKCRPGRCNRAAVIAKLSRMRCGHGRIFLFASRAGIFRSKPSRRACSLKGFRSPVRAPIASCIELCQHISN